MNEHCRTQVSLADYTTWRMGGRADLFYEPESREALALFLKEWDETLPIYWIGAGSNLLVRDGGLRGVVIRTLTGLNRVEIDSSGRLIAEAGVRLADLVNASHRDGLTGVEFLGAIPGTVGGAIRMNAGAYGHAIWDRVDAVELLDRRGEFQWIKADQVAVTYRAAHLDLEKMVTRVVFNLEQGELERAREQLAEWSLSRRERQPLDLPSCGSVFKNPEGDFAGRLIDAAGLKGRQVGKVQVSNKNANFMVNLGGAKAADAEALIEVVRSEVQTRFGVDLECEVIILGDLALKKGA